jgi:hypothetical protein
MSSFSSTVFPRRGLTASVTRSFVSLFDDQIYEHAALVFKEQEDGFRSVKNLQVAAALCTKKQLNHLVARDKDVAIMFLFTGVASEVKQKHVSVVNIFKSPFVDFFSGRDVNLGGQR